MEQKKKPDKIKSLKKGKFSETENSKMGKPVI